MANFFQISGAYGAYVAEYPQMLLNTGTAIVYNSIGLPETIYSNITGTKATAALTLPSGVSGSLPGQILRYVSAGAVTALTVNGSGNVLVGVPVTGMAANSSVAWQAISTTGTYIRIQ